MNKKNKLESESIGKLLLSLSLPAILGQLVSLIYNLVDRIYIGHMSEVGGLALTGVGITAPLILMIAAFAQLIGMGGVPLASIKMGEHKKEEGERILGNSFSALAICSVILMIIFFVFMTPLLKLFGASTETLDYAYQYLEIYVLGTPFVMMTIGMNPYITGQGFATKGMMTVSIGAIINILLDPIFIFTFSMGVKGAALATIISQAISAIWVLYFLSGKKTLLKLRKKNFAISSKILIPMIKLGLSPFIMTITESLLIISFNANLQHYVGDVGVGAMTILSSCMQFVFLPLSGLTQGAQPITSYNYGAENVERVKDSFKYLFIISVTYSCLIWLAMMIFPGFFASLFTSDQAIIRASSYGLRIYIAGAFALGVQISCQQTFIALGNAKSSLFLAILRKIILLIPLIYILPHFLTKKYAAILIAEPISDIVAAGVTAYMFFKEFKILILEMKYRKLN